MSDVERSVDDFAEQLCRDSSLSDILYSVASLATSNSSMRHRSAHQLMRALLSEGPRARQNSRLALLIVFLGLMDVRQQNRTSMFHQFMLCLTGVVVDDGNKDNTSQLLPAVISQLRKRPRLLELLPPAAVCMINTVSLMSQAPTLALRLSNLRTMG